MTVPIPTSIYRMVHIDNLTVLLERNGLHAPNHVPGDVLHYRTIHDASVQKARHGTRVTCCKRGTVHDYVPFCFGYLSPMLLQLKTGQVQGYNEGQRTLIYLVSYAQTIEESGVDFVFSDGHGLATYSHWYNDLDDLNQVDWSMVSEKYWSDNVNDMDRQRRKQAEFLIHQFCPWELIEEIGVFSSDMRTRVRHEMEQYDSRMMKPVNLQRCWYY